MFFLDLICGNSVRTLMHLYRLLRVLRAQDVPPEVLRQREVKWLDMLGHWDKWMIKRFNKVKTSQINIYILWVIIFLPPFLKLNMVASRVAPFENFCVHTLKQNEGRVADCTRMRLSWRCCSLTPSLVELVLCSSERRCWLPLRFHESAAGQDVTRPSISRRTTWHIDVVRLRVGWLVTKGDDGSNLDPNAWISFFFP